MDPDQRVIDYIKEGAEVIPIEGGGTISASQMLERFLFAPQVQWKPIGKLSGAIREKGILHPVSRIAFFDKKVNTNRRFYLHPG
ncbi:hypothetical protein [Dehalobacterium formicoaceticum]|uniref:hypothetical protein n=1 Tax=Dehalobacterium formicoaceticum TaxID=51515 RepID=UPI003B82D11E